MVLAIAFSSAIKARQTTQETPKQFMQVTSVESVLASGLGRSKLIITNADGTQTDSDLENLFSMVGVNFKNIKKNEDKVIKTLKSYTDNGWKIDHITSLTLSQNDTGAGGIFMPRYLLSKLSGKK